MLEYRGKVNGIPPWHYKQMHKPNVIRSTTCSVIYHSAFHTYRKTWTASRTWKTLDQLKHTVKGKQKHKGSNTWYMLIDIIQKIKDCKYLQRELPLSRRKYLHLFHLCRFLLGALWGPLGQELLGGLGLICQARSGNNESAIDSEITYNNKYYEKSL